MADVITLDLLRRISKTLREGSNAPAPLMIESTPFGGNRITAMWFDEMLGSTMWEVVPYREFWENVKLRIPRKPARRSASARKRKAFQHRRP